MHIPAALADYPTRSIGSFTISWGLLSIPLSVYVGSEDTYVPRKEFVDGETSRPAGRQTIDKSTGETVDNSRIVKMAEASNGSFVVLTDDEIKSCTMEKGVAEILAFVPKNRTSEYVCEDIAQVRPQKVKGAVNPAVKTAFSLFVSAMASRDVCALVKFSLRGPARFGLITATGDLYYIKSADQVRKALPLELASLSDAHMDLACQLIDAVGIGTPTILDETATKVRALVESKASGVEATPAAFPPPVVPEIDLMDSLLASIEAARAGK